MEIKMTIVREAVQHVKLATVQNADGKSGMMVRVRTEEAAVCTTK